MGIQIFIWFPGIWKSFNPSIPHLIIKINSDKETKEVVCLIPHVHQAASGKETKSVTRTAISTFEDYGRTDDFAKSQERNYDDVLINQAGRA